MPQRSAGLRGGHRACGHVESRGFRDTMAAQSNSAPPMAHWLVCGPPSMQHGCCCNQKVAILHPRCVCKELEWAKKGAKWCTVALAGKLQPHQVDKCSKWALLTPPNMFLGQPCSLGAGQHKPILQSCKELENNGYNLLALYGRLFIPTNKISILYTYLMSG